MEQVWGDYTRSVEELAGTRTADVLAHPDLAKVAGHRPPVPNEFYDRITEAVRSWRLAAELNSAGWRKPCGEVYPAAGLLARFHDYGVPVTTASDAHELADLCWRIPLDQKPRAPSVTARSPHSAIATKPRSRCDAHVCARNPARRELESCPARSGVPNSRRTKFGPVRPAAAASTPRLPRMHGQPAS